MPQIQLLDGKKIPFVKSITGFELTKKISKSLEKVALIMEVDGELKDLSYQINKDSKEANIAYKYNYNYCLKYLHQIQNKNYFSFLFGLIGVFFLFPPPYFSKFLL